MDSLPSIALFEQAKRDRKREFRILNIYPFMVMFYHPLCLNNHLNSIVYSFTFQLKFYSPYSLCYTAMRPRGHLIFISLITSHSLLHAATYHHHHHIFFFISQKQSHILNHLSLLYNFREESSFFYSRCSSRRKVLIFSDQQA